VNASRVIAVVALITAFSSAVTAQNFAISAA